MKLNFGCGNKVLEGYTNLDKDQCDLNKLPLPFKDSSVKEIYCSHVLEHLTIKPNELMREFLRILRDDGRIIIKVPHFSWHNAFDEDHERFFNCNAFSAIHKSNYEKDVYLTIDREFKIKFFKGYFFWNYPIEWFVNIHPKVSLLYECSFLCRLFPANEIVFTIKKKRNTQ